MKDAQKQDFVRAQHLQRMAQRHRGAEGKV
jgi:hypothetical protein